MSFFSDAWDSVTDVASSVWTGLTHATSNFIDELGRDPLKALNDLGNAFGLAGVNLNMAALRGRNLSEAAQADLTNLKKSRDVAEHIEKGEIADAAKSAYRVMKESGDVSGPVSQYSQGAVQLSDAAQDNPALAQAEILHALLGGGSFRAPDSRMLAMVEPAIQAMLDGFHRRAEATLAAAAEAAKNRPQYSRGLRASVAPVVYAGLYFWGGDHWSQVTMPWPATGSQVQAALASVRGYPRSLATWTGSTWAYRPLNAGE